jgi:L-lactate dehydrogenase complex protein LldG
MTEARDKILGRIRTALARRTPPPKRTGEPAPWFHPQAPDAESLIARFKAEFELLKGEFLRVPAADDARLVLNTFLDRHAIRTIAASDDPILRQLFGARDVRWIDPKAVAGASLDGVDLGVTRADALAATTASVFLSARSGTGRALSVLPPTHLVVALKDEVVLDLSEGLKVWERLYGSRWPSNAFIITGPSRTADIEKMLVLGAHGPKRIVTLLLG